MNPINPVCRPATENEINYGEAKWCAKCTSECDGKGKDKLVMCDYFKTNDNAPIVPGCPSLMPHALPFVFDGVALAEEGTPMPEPKDFAAKAKREREATREKSSQVGNAAKLREACEALMSEIGGYLTDGLEVVWCSISGKTIKKACAALAAPPRNCDVGKPEEQQDRFREFCRRHFDARECGLGRSVAKCPAYQGGKNPDCSLWWAQMPYEEGGAK